MPSARNREYVASLAGLLLLTAKGIAPAFNYDSIQIIAASMVLKALICISG